MHAAAGWSDLAGIVQVGLWGTDPWNPDSMTDLAEDGVLLLHPHDAYASALCWLDGNLVTAAYDGTVRLLDVGAATWTVLRRDDVDGFSAMGAHGQNMLLLAFDAVRESCISVLGTSNTCPRVGASAVFR